MPLAVKLTRLYKALLLKVSIALDAYKATKQSKLAFGPDFISVLLKDLDCILEGVTKQENKKKLSAKQIKEHILLTSKIVLI